MTGLAVMGANLARNLARHGYRVAVHNRHPDRTRTLHSHGPPSHSPPGHGPPSQAA